METVIKSFLPEEVINDVFAFLSSHDDLEVKITKARQSKWGDLRFIPQTGKFLITINGNLNKYEFLLTLVHEVAHYLTIKKYGKKVKPHGPEWKKEFSDLLKKCAEEHDLPPEIAEAFFRHAHNPKAAISTDRELRKALQRYSVEPPLDSATLEMLKEGDFFIFHGKIFERLEQRRKLIKCREVNNNKFYLFQPDVIVKRIPNDEI